MTVAGHPDSTRAGMLRWSLVVRLLLVSVVIVTIIRSVDAHTVRQFKDAQLSMLVPVLLVFSPLALVARCERWRVLTPRGNTVSRRSFIAAYLLGFLANSIMPGKFGDLVKAKLVCHDELTYGASLTTALIDRLIEGTALLLVAPLIVSTVNVPLWFGRMCWIAFAVSLGMLFTLSLAPRNQRLLTLILDALFSVRLLNRWKESVESKVAGIVEAVQAMHDLRLMITALLLSAVVWIAELGAVSCCLLASHIDVPLGIASLALLLVITFGTLVPLSPGSVGVYQVLCVLALSMWRVPASDAVAFGLIMQLTLFLPMYAAGIVCLLAMRGSNVQIMKVKKA